MDNLDPEEIAKFSTMAANWWDLNGDLRTLHQINPIRLQFAKENCIILNQKILDIGCGGGIFSESLIREGADVTGIDLSEEAINVAKLHCLEQKLNIDYQCISSENFAEQHPEAFDLVTCLEMLEHVPNPQSTVNSCAALVKPQGHVIFSTLNRTPKAYLFAILGAEYILKLIPKNTHHYGKFIKPSELQQMAQKAGLTLKAMQGIRYNPLTKHFSKTNDLSVNYLACYQRV